MSYERADYTGTLRIEIQDVTKDDLAAIVQNLHGYEIDVDGYIVDVRGVETDPMPGEA